MVAKLGFEVYGSSVIEMLRQFLTVESKTGIYTVNSRYQRKIWLSSFHLNGHTLRISSTDSKVRTILYSKMNSPTGKYCSVAFIRMVTI